MQRCAPGERRIVPLSPIRFPDPLVPKLMRSCVVSAFLVAAVSGCTAGADRHTSSRSATLVALDSIVLQESDTSYIGQPFDLAVGPDGSFFISDGFTRQVLVFARDGRYLRGIGRRGSGPGEFSGPTWLALAGDSLLYVVDRTEINAFDPTAGTFRWSRSLPSPRGPTMLATYGDHLFAGEPDSLRNGSVAVVESQGSAIRTVGHLPALQKHPVTRAMWDGVAVALAGGRIATAHAVNDYVYVGRLAGGRMDSIRVPVARRQGVQAELIRRFADRPADRRVAERALYGSSMPMDLHWLPSGMLGLVSLDWKVRDGRVVGSNYLSVVDPAGRRGCVDAPVPGTDDPAPRVGFRGDTLFVLSQDVGRDGRASTLVRAYRIDTASCDWVSAGGGR